MSQQSGITISPQLRQIFAGCNDGHIRMIKMAIANEQIILDMLNNTLSNWEDDWNKLIGPSLIQDQPCYILFRLDTHSQAATFDWIFLSYCPDTAPVKQKMLHASTKATLKREFGEGAIRADIFGTLANELSLESYKQKLLVQSAPKPLTSYEEDLIAIREREFRPDINATTKHAVMKGVSFPLTDTALSALRIFGQGRYNFVILTVDTVNEEVTAESSGNVASADELGQRLPQGHARFVLFRYLHNNQGKRTEPVLFIYYVPAGGCPIKEKMMFSSCKNVLVGRLEELLCHESPNNNIVKSLEIDSPLEISTNSLNHALGVAEVAAVAQMPAVGSRPAPPGRGPRRMIRTPDQN